jgi:hypothetical protein
MNKKRSKKLFYIIVLCVSCVVLAPWKVSKKKLGQKLENTEEIDSIIKREKNGEM